MLRRTTALLFLTLCVLAAASASAQTFVFHLRGDQEVPPVPSTASGGCMGTLNQPAAQFTLTCVHNVLNATLMHIHRGAAGVNGPIAFDLGAPTSPVTATWSGMTAADISDLLAGSLYINIHSSGRPAGDIRGQILSRTVDTVAFTADGSQVVPPGAASGSASCTADLDASATGLAVQCTHTVASPTSARIHEAPFGQNGPVVFTFPSPASPLSATVPMTPQLVADFAATFLYLQIEAGESEEASVIIRGQIGTPPAGAGTGTIRIVKTTNPAGGTNFGFTQTVDGSGPFTLNDGQTKTFSTVAAGTYTITENDPSGAGYSLGDISCNDADSTTSLASRSATVQLQGAETVTCTFRNVLTAPTDTQFIFHLSGDQEAPPVPTTARGGCMVRFDTTNSRATFVCTHSVVSATVMHVHRGAPGVNGPIVFDLGNPTSPVIATWTGMTPTDVTDLLGGNLYVNIHTAGRPSGEIRGQILPRTVDVLNFTLDGSQVVPPGTSPATGNCTSDLDANATSVAFACTHNLAAPTAAHVHQAPRGANGPVVFTFPSAASPMNANMPVTPRLVADYAGGLLYLDVHGTGGSESAPADQIRGQIELPLPTITTGTIRIVKSTTPAGGTGFQFTDNVPGSGGTFTLNDGGTRTFSSVPAGTYTITESATPGYTLTDVRCEDNDSTGNAFARNATVRLQAGEVVTCTFHNLQSIAASSPYVFHLSGAQEVPPVATSARGGCMGQLDAPNARFSIVCTHNVVGPTLAHIHQGAPGVNGPIVFDLGNQASPIEATWTGMTQAQIADLIAGNYYVNVHAGGRPAGEIRGQILPRTVDNFTFPMGPDQEVPPVTSSASGSCFTDLSNDASSLFLQCSHNVMNVTDAHLHGAPPGFDGPVIFHLPTTSSFSQTLTMNPRLVADFAAGFLYVNIHSVDFPEGEIRGQLIAGAAPPPAVIPTVPEWMLLLVAAALVVVAVARMRV